MSSQNGGVSQGHCARIEDERHFYGVCVYYTSCTATVSSTSNSPQAIPSTIFSTYCQLQGRAPLWSSGHSSWLQIQRSGFDSRRYQIFWEVVGLERGSLSLVSATEELLERNSSGSGLENREYGRRDPTRLPHGILYLHKLALTSPTSVGRSVGIVRSRTKATQLVKRHNCPRNRPWRPIGLWDVEAPTLSRQSVHRGRFGS
jgi:hypothetical protein